MSTAVTGQEGDLAALKLAQDKGVGRVAEGGFYAFFVYVGESGHRIESAAANNADFRLSQGSLLVRRPFWPRVSFGKHLSIKVGAGQSSDYVWGMPGRQ